MRLEPLSRQSDWVALTSIICGLAPLPLLLMTVLPLIGMLVAPFLLLSVPGAIGFGIAGIVRAKSQPEPNYVQPATGLVLGLVWLCLVPAAAVFFSHVNLRD